MNIQGLILEGLHRERVLESAKSTQFPDADIKRLSSEAKKTVQGKFGKDVSKMYLEVSVAPNGSIAVSGNSKLKKDGRTPYLDNDKATDIFSAYLNSIKSELSGKVSEVSNSKRTEGVIFFSVLLYNDAMNESVEPISEASQEQRIIDFVKKQVNIDITKYRDEDTKKFDKRGKINVDWKRMPKTEQQAIMNLTTVPYNILQLDSNNWMMCFSIKKGSK